MTDEPTTCRVSDEREQEIRRRYSAFRPESCSLCYFRAARYYGTGYDEVCARYPELAGLPRTGWCGEFKAKES